MKVLITGGHVTPALAVIEEFKDHEIVFVGRKYALEQEQTLSFEYKEITKKGIKFINLTTGKINRGELLLTISSVLRIPLGFYQAFRILQTEKPNVIMSFGSYLAVPIAVWSYLLNIPIYLHEQTSVPGQASRVIGKFAKKIFISFPETKTFFPTEKIRLTGNPVRQGIFNVIKKPFELPTDRPVLYITGGSLGSHSINEHVEKILESLLKKHTVIHQVGDTKQYRDYERLLAKKKSLDKFLQNRYFLVKHFSEDEIGYIYLNADLIIGRAGANTFFELLVLEKPAVFIPLPWSAEKEQQKQAEIFKTAGVGEIFLQSDTSKNLERKISLVFENISKYKDNFKNLKKLYKENAARSIAVEILKN